MAAYTTARGPGLFFTKLQSIYITINYGTFLTFFSKSEKVKTVLLVLKLIVGLCNNHVQVTMPLTFL